MPHLSAFKIRTLVSINCHKKKKKKSLLSSCSQWIDKAIHYASSGAESQNAQVTRLGALSAKGIIERSESIQPPRQRSLKTDYRMGWRDEHNPAVLLPWKKTPASSLYSTIASPQMKLTAVSGEEVLFHITLSAGTPWKSCRVSLH